MNDKILRFYKHNKNLKDILIKFSRNKNFVYDFLSDKNIEITDKMILDIFVSKNKKTNLNCISSTTLKYFLKNYKNNVFIKNVIDFLNEKYSDSLSINETISRIFNKITVRPKCKECSSELKFYSLNNPFQKFCSRKCANKNEESKQKVIKTCIAKYGVTNSFKSEIVKQKYKDNLEEKYGKGIINSFQIKTFKEKAKETKLKRYGFETFNNREKSEKTCLAKYGVKCTTQISAVRKKQQARYKYDNLNFDSLPEIAYYIWLKDHNIDFEYQPNVSFKYVFENKVHFYFPDFKVKDQLIEIKGNQFFKENKMINPYDKDQNNLYEAKHQCMISNNVKILKNKDYKKYLDYIFKKYGNNYLKQFKNK